MRANPELARNQRRATGASDECKSGRRRELHKLLIISYFIGRKKSPAQRGLAFQSRSKSSGGGGRIDDGVDPPATGLEQDYLGRVSTSAATGGNAEGISQFIERHHAAGNGPANVAIGHRFADTDVHALPVSPFTCPYLSANENDCQ